MNTPHATSADEVGLEVTPDLHAHTHDINGRPYARLSTLKPGSLVQVDEGFERCFIPWSTLPVVSVNGRLALIHNAPECGACGGTEHDCPHTLDGQLEPDGDTLIGVYHV